MPDLRVRSNQGLGWIPQLPDHRDYKYSQTHSGLTLVQKNLTIENKAGILQRVDTTPLFPEGAYDQSILGSCVGNGVGGAGQFALARENKPAFRPSRLLIYYLARQIEGTIPVDAGCQIRDALKAVTTIGMCPEELWQYDISKFADKPSDQALAACASNIVLQYEAVEQNKDAIIQCLVDGFPVIIGATVYSKFMQDRSPNVEMELPGADEVVEGGHCTLVCGFDLQEDWLIMRNSWGQDWSPTWKGYYVMRPEYLLNPDLASDFWCIKVVQ